MHVGADYGKQQLDIDDSLLENPAAQGFLDPKGQWSNKTGRLVYVYDNEGPYPHCHVVGLGKDKHKEVCVRLDKAEYFCHGTKQSKFTATEKKMFMKFMNSADKYGVVRWNWAASTWDGFAQNNDNMNQISIKSIPDYEQLDVE